MNNFQNAQVFFNLNNFKGTMMKSSIPNATLYWDGINQTIDGFGTFAGRAETFFSDSHRDEILSSLFGDNGLNLSILRAEVMPSFSPEEGVIDFNTDADIDVRMGDPGFPAPGSTDLIQRGQLWIMKNAKSLYGVDKVVASTWSPPLYMKTIPGQGEGKNLNRLNPDYDMQYASYLAQFAAAMNSTGVPLWAISPMNEPEYPTTEWDGTVWFSRDIARFAPVLKNSLQQISPDTKVMIGETANWQVDDFYLANTFITNSDSVDILASHGYSLPNIIEGTVSYNTTPLPWLLTQSDKPRWITESCSTESYDPSMKTGMKLAISMHKFLATQKLSAFIFWSAIGGNSNEALVNSDLTQYTFTKTYDVMGNFSRYIRPGDVCIDISNYEPMPEVYISAYRGVDNRLTIVVINNNDDSKELGIKLDGVVLSTLTPYTTTSDKDARWLSGQSISSDSIGQFNVTLPGQSVTTLCGE